MKNLIWAALPVLISTSAFAGTVNVTCDYAKVKSAKSVKAHPRDLIVVSAVSNATTGYSWVSKEGHQSRYDQNGGPAIGAGGTQVFEINAKKNEVLTFEYKRAWESKAVSVCKVRVTID